MHIKTLAAAFLLAGVSTYSFAKVSAEEAERLGNDLTPVGAETAANADGTIPAWDGGVFIKDARAKTTERYKDLYEGEKPLFTITAQNVDEHKDKLSEGQLAMFTKYKDSYKMDVYPSHRPFANPDFVYEATKKNALTAELTGGGEALVNAITGIPFPIPKSGKEAIWNHKTRYRGLSGKRYNAQIAVQSGGAFSVYLLEEDVKFSYSYPNQTTEDLNNVMIYFMQVTQKPAREKGRILLVHETMDQVAEPRRAWLYNAGQRRLRRAPNAGYDNPGAGSDGLRTNDQLDAFNGATDRYNWKLVGKKEMYIPYNAFKLGSDKLKYADIIKAGHINQDLARYELHRVWIVEATKKDGTSHIYQTRRFFIDEDSWGVSLVDIYDKRGELWRFQEAHYTPAYDQPLMGTSGATIYDLQSNRYLGMGFTNEEPMTQTVEFPDSHFTTSNVKKLARK